MPFWDRDRWRPIQEYYGGAAKQGLKRCIEAVDRDPYEELDNLDHLSLREWMRRYTTTRASSWSGRRSPCSSRSPREWWEHSASENLYVRKLHYERKRTAGYSFWPMGGWDQLWNAMAGRLRGTRAASVRQPGDRGARARGGRPSRACGCATA